MDTSKIHIRSITSHCCRGHLAARPIRQYPRLESLGAESHLALRSHCGRSWDIILRSYWEIYQNL